MERKKKERETIRAAKQNDAAQPAVAGGSK
jgi:hypothetical protein